MTQQERLYTLYIGRCVRLFRLKSGMTQQALAKELNISFQQVQKYENGTNRISAAKLCRVSHILKYPLHLFLPPRSYFDDKM